MSNLNEFKDMLVATTFGEQGLERKRAGVCVKCGEPFTDKNVHTEAGWKETKISNMCEDCFNSIFEGAEDEED